jgi:ectoine hydroxylase-related dioxygenase (phytanoyl-CoA dioxygenase family)
MINETALLPTSKDIAFFEEKGYWICPKIISDERLDEIQVRMDRVYNEDFETGKPPWNGYWKTGDNPRALRKTDNSHWSDTVLGSVATDSIIGAAAGALMKAESIRLWHDQLLYKPGRNTKKETANVGWHQDYSYWQCAATPSLVTAWVAFTDVDLSNGCMQMVPYSHRWGLVNVNDFFEQDLEKQRELMNVPEGYSFEPVPIVMKAGQVSFHHALTIHGSGPNVTDEARRSMAVHLMTGDTRYRSGTKGDHHMNVSLLNGKDGDLFAGDWFPIVYQR